jgi:hypothetical protein
MRHWHRLLSILLLACSSTEGPGGGSPDAALAPDASLSADAATADAALFVDGPPGVDARTDATAATDARPDATATDAAGMTPDAQVLSLRPWSGAVARLRVLDLRMFGPEVGFKLCVFGSDSDPRPYAVLVTRSLAPNVSHTIPATYVNVPAAAGLTAHVVTFTLLGAQEPDPSPAGCRRDSAESLRGAAGLTAGASYTAAYDVTDAFFAQCARSTEPGCEFYPKWGNETAATSCAEDGLRVFRDGHLGTGGFRVINMTADAALLSHSPSLGLRVEVPHVDVPFNFAESYEATIPADGTYLCPEYVTCTTAALAVDPFTECTTGNPSWRVGEITSARIGAAGKFTSFYVVGDVRDLAANRSGLIGPSPTVVTVHDVAN